MSHRRFPACGIGLSVADLALGGVHIGGLHGDDLARAVAADPAPSGAGV